MSECCDNIINPMENQTGLTMNSLSGPLSWPYAACTGDVNKNGIFESLSPEKGLQKCLEFCDKRKELTGEDSPSSDFIKLTGMGNPISGTQQCYMIYNNMKKVKQPQHRIESFKLKPTADAENYFWVIPLVLISFLLIGLIMLQK